MRAQYRSRVSANSSTDPRSTDPRSTEPRSHVTGLLFGSERREFVMAEIRRPGMGRERISTRGTELDKQRAVMTARNPKDSKFGECLLNVNTKQDPVLKSRLGKITAEMKRMEFRVRTTSLGLTGI